MKKILSLFLALAMMLSMMAAMAHAEGGKKHVSNLVVGTTTKNSVFNMTSQTDAFGRMNYNGLTQGNYVYRDEGGTLQPYFFRTFEISEDGTTIDFTWHKGSIWHDGVPVTDEDIVFSFEFQRDVKKVGSLANLTAVEITGENAARLVFSKPDAYYYLNTSVMNTACVYAKHIWENIEDYANYRGEDAAIGCGPYKLVSHDEDAQTSYYEAVPENAFLGELTVDSVTVQTYPDQATLMMAMMNGEIDTYYAYASPIDATLVETFSGIDGLDIGQRDFSGSYQMLFGCNRAPGNDVNFRQAVAYAINYEIAAAAVCGEFGKMPGRGILNPACHGYDDSIGMLETDTEKAKQMLEEAGYVDADADGWRESPNGEAIDLAVIPQYSSARMALNSRLGDIIIASLKDVGINSHIDEEALANSEIWEDRVTKEDYDISITFCTSGMTSYTSAFRYILADLREGDSGWHWGSYHNDEFRDTYFAMTEAVSEEDYLKNCSKLQHMADEEMFALTLAWQTGAFPYRTDKYENWNNWTNWGTVNAETWFTLTEK